MIQKHHQVLSLVTVGLTPCAVLDDFWDCLRVLLTLKTRTWPRSACEVLWEFICYLVHCLLPVLHFSCTTCLCPPNVWFTSPPVDKYSSLCFECICAVLDILKCMPLLFKCMLLLVFLPCRVWLPTSCWILQRISWLLIFHLFTKRKKIDLLQSAVRLDLIYSYGQVIDVTKY